MSGRRRFMKQEETSTYYDLPALKPTHWDWKVSGYIFAAGLSGGAQLLATLAPLRLGRRGESIQRNGRYLALAGALVSAPLLIADLQTPKRWYNMLRIFRRTSPMSFGSYILSSFGFFSGLAALGQFLADRGHRLGAGMAHLAQVPAAAIGAFMSCYTGSLLSATSTPLWAAAPRLLAARLAASSMAVGAAALSLGEEAGGRNENSRRLDAFAGVATGISLALSLLSKRHYRREGLDAPLQEGPAAACERGALLLGHGVPLACYAFNLLSGRRSSTASLVASLSVIAGGYLTREALLRAGNASAERPRDYFRFARRRHTRG